MFRGKPPKIVIIRRPIPQERIDAALELVLAMVEGRR